MWLSPLSPCVVVTIIYTPYMPMALVYSLSSVNGLNSYTIDLQIACCIPAISALTSEMEEAWLVMKYEYEYEDSLCYLRPQLKWKKNTAQLGYKSISL